jgi:hypothetical protein
MKKGEIIGVLLFISFFVWALISRSVNQSELKLHGKVVNAKIVSWKLPGKGSTVYNLECRFNFAGKEYELISPTTYEGNFDKMIGRSFPGIFSPEKQIFEILITPEDFLKFNIPFPDSLSKKWKLDKFIDE